jgi:hypothetical protein
LKSKTTYFAIAVGVGIIALAIFFTYSADQAKNRGQYYGDSLKLIQEELKQTQTEFYSKKTMLDENTITTQDFASFGNTHIQKMREILTKYDTLNPPETFVKSTQLFRASTQKQIESDESLIEWILTNDTSHKIRSDLLLQESFENEMAALALFNQAKDNAGQN